MFPSVRSFISTTISIDLTTGPSGLYATLNTLYMEKEKKITQHQDVNKDMIENIHV